MPAWNDNLRDAREALGMTRQAVADKINMSLSAYSLYESGKREPNLETLSRICTILHTTPNNILGYGDGFDAAAAVWIENGYTVTQEEHGPAVNCRPIKKGNREPFRYETKGTFISATQNILMNRTYIQKKQLLFDEYALSDFKLQQMADLDFYLEHLRDWITDNPQPPRDKEKDWQEWHKKYQDAIIQCWPNR